MNTKLLEMNPEFYTMWNNRRLVLQSYTSKAQQDSIHHLITADLSFLLPLLRKFPKCYWIWKYRLWLLHEASRLLSPTTTRQLWEKELSLVSKMLSLDSRNFHGWGYRRTVVGALESFPPPPSSEDETNASSMTESEFAYTTQMIETNLSNFSAWHRRSKLIPKLLDERKASDAQRRDFLDRGRYIMNPSQKPQISHIP